MKNIYLSILIILGVIPMVMSQVQKASTLHIGNTSTNSLNSSAALQLDETVRGFLPPRLTSAQRNLIVSPVQGLTVFNITTNCLEWFDGSSWFLPCGYVNVSQTSGGKAIVSGYSCNGASSGILTLNTLASDVTQTITATVTKVGTYNISTKASNGVIFSGSGVFKVTGPQDVVLTATGIPVINGPTTFTLTTTPSCSFDRDINPLVNIPVSIPNTITLNKSQKYLVASAYDTDYLPFSAPNAPASIEAIAADKSDELYSINVQGVIYSATPISLKIPVTANSSGTLPAYKITIAIPSSLTEDELSRNLIFSWDRQGYDVNTKAITASIVAVGGDLKVKKLDINSGLGSDFLGLLLGEFAYPFDSTGMTTTFEVRAVSLIPDRMAGIKDNTGSDISHMMFYAPVVAEDGKVWLNNNLGVINSRINNWFSPIETDFPLPLGPSSSLFQWGRNPDGHELISDYKNPYKYINRYSDETSETSDSPSHAKFIIGKNGDWRDLQNFNLWADEYSGNNPCPKGFRVPSVTEFQNLRSSSGTSSILKLGPTSERRELWVNDYSGRVIFWTSSADEYYGSFLSYSFDFLYEIDEKKPRFYGLPVRCIKN